MDKLSVTEFRDFCYINAPMTFIFDTVNQPNGEVKDVKAVQKYTQMACMLNPNRIMFSNEQGTLCLNRVKYIRLNREANIAGYLFIIVCGNRKDNSDDSSYAFIADYR